MSFPMVSLMLVEEKTDVLVQMLEQGGIDCALLAMPIANEHLDSVKLFREPFTLAVAATDPLAKRKSVSVNDLRNVNMLLLDEGHCLRDQALHVCQSIGIGEARNFRATSLETLRHMVAGGNAVTLMPQLAVRTDDASMRYIPFKEPVPSRVIGLYWRKTSGRASLFHAIQKKLYP